MPAKFMRNGKMKIRARIPKTDTIKVTKNIRVPKLKDSTKAGVMSVVKRALARASENKWVGKRMEVATGHNSAIGAGDAIAICPEISQGTSAQERVGDRVTPKYLSVRGVVSLVRQQPDAKQLYVRVMCLAQKNIKVGSSVTGVIDAAHLLRPGIPGGDQIQYTGTTSNITDPVNKDLFRVYYDRTFKLSPASDQTLTGDLLQSSFKWAYKFKQLPSSLTFDDGNGDYPNNFAPFYVIGYAYADGTNPDVGTLRIVSTTSSYLGFEDS